LPATRYNGHGSVLKRGATVISLINLITPPTKSREKIDATALSDSARFSIGSDPPDHGELVVEQWWQDGDANHELLDSDFDANTNTTWSIVLANVNRTWTFSAWVMNVAPEQVIGTSAYKRAITFAITSIPTRS